LILQPERHGPDVRILPPTVLSTESIDCGRLPEKGEARGRAGFEQRAAGPSPKTTGAIHHNGQPGALPAAALR